MNVIVHKPDRATAYAERVASGDIPACIPHRQACERHLRDLSRQGSPEFPYTWVPEKSEDILDFAETLTILEGYEPRPVRLYGCQNFDLGVPFGWVNPQGYRRFRVKYKSVARQNGKTFENGITAGYVAAFCGYIKGLLVCAATGQKQARLAWKELENFILADPDLAAFFDIKEYISTIIAMNTGCSIEAISKEAGLQEGFRSIYASLDEIHQHKDNSVYSAIKKGQRALAEALLSMITTRGRNLNSFCYDMDKLCLNILACGTTSEDFFVDIYTIDQGKDIFDPKFFLESNPVLCATERGMQTMLTDAATAKAMGGDELADYIVKCQNQWLEDPEIKFATALMLQNARCEDGLAAYAGLGAYAGIDLSHGGDLTTLALEFDVPAGRDYKGFYCWSISFMPRGQMERHKSSDLAPYDLWEMKELIRVTGSNGDFKNDYGFIISELKRITSIYNIKLLGIGYDPHNADGFLQQLDQFGVPLLECVQSARFLSSATEDVQLLMMSGDYHFDRHNELMDWSFRNAEIVKNSFGEKKIDKNPKGQNKRIDPCDAAIDAHVARMKLTEHQVDVNAHMAQYLKKMGWDGKEPQ